MGMDMNKLLGQMQQLEQGLAPFRDEDPDQRPWPSPAAREKCRSDADRSEQLLAEIMQLERQGEDAYPPSGSGDQRSHHSAPVAIECGLRFKSLGNGQDSDHPRTC